MKNRFNGFWTMGQDSCITAKAGAFFREKEGLGEVWSSAVWRFLSSRSKPFRQLQPRLGPPRYTLSQVAIPLICKAPLIFSPSRQTEGGQAKGENVLLWDGEQYAKLLAVVPLLMKEGLGEVWSSAVCCFFPWFRSSPQLPPRPVPPRYTLSQVRNGNCGAASRGAGSSGCGRRCSRAGGPAQSPHHWD